jgi:HAD superfamily hydrolase (TIGR01549 family)
VYTGRWKVEGLKACLFDFGGTLDADGATWQDRFYALYGKHGVCADREAFRQAFYDADDTLTETRALEAAGLEETIETQGRRVWQTLGLGSGGERLDAIVADFLEGLRWHVERNRKLLVLLKGRYDLGIVSNFYGNLDRVCEDLGIRNLFVCIVDSTCEGVVKPDPRIFQAALNRIGIGPKEAVFVGDNPVRDMEGARGVGMAHIWLAGDEPGRRETCCPGDPVIQSLEALGPILMNGHASTLREVVG